ncbi:MAG: folylpolyglutamate synthase/dihydrofolate synthase family protein [Dehalococcoidia bacterium]|nr:folylpolyglutamate synthase/dihydrofolate synthase family protein [Dehalococcoidia bacterium]
MSGLSRPLLDYKGAIEYINSFTDFEKLASLQIEPFDLTRIERLLGVIGNPHLHGRTFHVAGTKGKGSTSAMLASVLRAEGYHTGLFTSPHLHSFRERIRVDGRPIPEKDLSSLVDRARPLVEDLHREGSMGRITTFELTTLIAFLYFDEAGADYRVIEAGLGGRLDATNVVRPLLAILTSISLDHTSVLGFSLRQVAGEKAGIIKAGSTVISAPQPPEAVEVIRQTCQERGARLVLVGQDVGWRRISAGLDGQTVHVRTKTGDFHFRIPLLGRFQCENAALVVASCEEARALGVVLSPRSVLQGLRQVVWPGRMQILQTRPLVLVDGAHNVNSADVLRGAVKEDLPFRRCVLVIGTSVDKDIAGIAAELAPLADTVIATRSHHPRSASPEAVAEAFRACGKEVRIASDTPSAMAEALDLATPEDLVLVTGSLFVVAETLAWAGQVEVSDGV